MKRSLRKNREFQSLSMKGKSGMPEIPWLCDDCGKHPCECEPINNPWAGESNAEALPTPEQQQEMIEWLLGKDQETIMHVFLLCPSDKVGLVLIDKETDKRIGVLMSADECLTISQKLAEAVIHFIQHQVIPNSGNQNQKGKM